MGLPMWGVTLWGLFAVDEEGHQTLLSQWPNWAKAKEAYRNLLKLGEQRKLLILPLSIDQ